MRRKRSQSPLTPKGGISPHRTTRASSRSPKILGAKAPISPTKESQHSVNCEASANTGSSHSRHVSGHSNNSSPNGPAKEICSSFRRSTRVNKSLSYHENESEEELDNETGIASKNRSLRGSSKRANNDTETTNGKRFRSGNQRRHHDVSNHSFVTTDEVTLKSYKKIFQSKLMESLVLN